MARSSEQLTTEEEEEIWGTWEELLLACAVNRHGAHSWDSIASEVRSRSPYADLLTADNCMRRYRRLKRRFADGISGGGDEIDGEEEPEPTAVEIPWLDELRKLRVAELRQEVQRYDVSIGSLQLKVKKLKEERERSLRESEAEAEAGDDAANGSGSGSGSGSDPKESNDQQKDRTKSLPDKASGGRISGEDSGRSCKESNSTEPKAEEDVKIEERIKGGPDPAVNGSRSGSRSDPVAGTAVSYNGSSDTIKEAARSLAVEPNLTRNVSGESVSESKGGDEGEEGTKESSDVQSSASFSRRRRGGRRRRASAAAEPDAEAQSPARKSVDVESQPLIAFLETLRSNKYGSFFDRRLDSQETVKYRALIRRHVDVEMVRKRIGRNGYTGAEFFRDLLLLCNNALVFYAKNSPESISAVHLRDIINKEIAATLRKAPQPSPQSVKEPTPPPAATAQPPLLTAVKPKPDADQGSAPLEKPAPLPPLVACRKRSSISGKPSKPAKKVEKEGKKVENEEESEEEGEEKDVEKKSMKQQRTAVSRGLRTNKTRSNSKGGGGGGGSGAKNSNPVSAPKPEPAEQETKSGGGGSTAKKKSAADFLNRMKSSSPSSSNGKLVESLKCSSGSKRGGGGEQKRKPSSKEESKKEAKRSVGRPPKRAAAQPAKRPREEKTPPPLPKKRGRR